MTKSEFSAYNESIKSNGENHGLKWIKSEQHRKIMIEYMRELKKDDKLAERAKMQTTETKRLSFLLTY